MEALNVLATLESVKNTRREEIILQMKKNKGSLVKKYGKENFTKEILVESNDNIRLLEKQYLENVNARYNLKYYNMTNDALGNDFHSNDTKKSNSFQVGFQDYGAGDDGTADVPVDKYSMYSLSKYMVVSPTLIELKPRETKVINVTVDIPDGDSMAISMWTILTIDQVIDREKLEIPNITQNAIGMGIKNTFGFGINVFQNPPNLIVNNVEIVAMNFNKKSPTSTNNIFMKAKNAGTGIGYCLYYLELTNLVTGKQTKLKVKQFAIFPGYSKTFNFDLPADIKKGPYSAMAVLDFGNKEELQTAELEFTVE